LTRRIDRRWLVREFQYDTLGRNTAEIWYDTAADAEMHANRHNTLSFTYDAPGRMRSAAHVDADLRDAIPPASEMPDHAIPPASEMPDHVNILPAAEKRVDFTYDSASQPSALTRYGDLSGNQLVAATDYPFDKAKGASGSMRFPIRCLCRPKART
jgi:hypothetical protein